jgi:hypothetical protein
VLELTRPSIEVRHYSFANAKPDVRGRQYGNGRKAIYSRLTDVVTSMSAVACTVRDPNQPLSQGARQ